MFIWSSIKKKGSFENKRTQLKLELVTNLVSPDHHMNYARDYLLETGRSSIRNHCQFLMPNHVPSTRTTRLC